MSGEVAAADMAELSSRPVGGSTKGRSRKMTKKGMSSEVLLLSDLPESVAELLRPLDVDGNGASWALQELLLLTVINFRHA